MHILFIFLMLSLVSPALSAVPASQENKIYKSIDKEGRVSYSDIPRRNAVVVPMRETTSTTLDTKESKITEFSSAKFSSQPKRHENMISIEQPKDQETLQNTGGELNITVSSSYPFAQGYKWQAVIDGQKTGEPQTGNNITLQNIERGEHILQIHAIDTHGKVLASSAIITFYIHQAVVPPPQN